MKQTTRLLVSILAVGLLGTGALSAQVSRGEIEAVFNAGATGGNLILFSGPGEAPEFAAFAEGKDGVIHPWDDGKGFSAEDWHCLLFGVGVVNDYPTASGALDLVEVWMWLDGNEIALTEQPVKRDLTYHGYDPSIPLYSISWGKIYSPTELAVGPHTLHTTIKYDGNLWYEREITFIIN